MDEGQIIPGGNAGRIYESNLIPFMSADFIGRCEHHFPHCERPLVTKCLTSLMGGQRGPGCLQHQIAPFSGKPSQPISHQAGRKIAFSVDKPTETKTLFRGTVL